MSSPSLEIVLIEGKRPDETLVLVEYNVVCEEPPEDASEREREDYPLHLAREYTWDDAVAIARAECLKRDRPIYISAYLIVDASGTPILVSDRWAQPYDVQLAADWRVSRRADTCARGSDFVDPPASWLG